MADIQATILIVDDDAEDLASVERTLRPLGTKMVSIKDPHEVIRAVQRVRPDVVILDALLPGVPGFDLCKEIKTSPELKGTQVLIVTGVYLRQQYRQEALQQFKADGFLTKPYRPPELLRLVVQLLSRKTRTPPSRFFKRAGISASPERKRQSWLERFLGKNEPEEPLTLGIGTVSSDEPVERSRPAAAEPEPIPDPVFEPAAGALGGARIGSETIRFWPKGKGRVPEIEAPIPSPAASAAHTAEPAPAPLEPPVEERPAFSYAPEPENGAEALAAIPVPAEPAAAAMGAVAEMSPEPFDPHEVPPSVLLDQPAVEEEVRWIEVDLRPQEPSAEVSVPPGEPLPAAPTVLEELVSETEEPEAPVSEPHDVVEPVVARAESPSPMRHPLYRVGEVPIYDEPDFLTELKRELSKCRRVDRPLTLILIRIGDLGQIVELFGKDFREQVLWHIAEHAMGSLRVVDLVGMMASKDRIAMTAFASDRYGGGRIVARMRQSVARKPFRVSEELPPIVPALDFGIASFPADGSDVEALLHRAEEDLAQSPPATSE
jgi:diguanylate cyclase (GGDEF)-like protein